jgi:hypothetical protein
MGYFRILAAIPGFFVSAVILMALWTWATAGLGLADMNYIMAMKINIILWLAVAPLAAVGRKH